MPKKKGFTLIELLIVVSILAILLIVGLVSVKNYRDRAEDARAKADLDRLKIAFEEYYYDHNCYPPVAWFDDASDCGSTNLSPYLNNLPCDRNTGLPYVLETDDSTCDWYKLYATFNLPGSDDAAIAQRSSTGSTKGNYGVSSTNVVVNVFYDGPLPSFTPTPTPTPTPSPGTNYYYCSTTGYSGCTSFNPLINNCTPSFINDPYCGGGANPCTSIGTCNPL